MWITKFLTCCKHKNVLLLASRRKLYDLNSKRKTKCLDKYTGTKGEDLQVEIFQSNPPAKDKGRRRKTGGGNSQQGNTKLKTRAEKKKM